MKVSILTYHDEDNYGATLQAYATYKAVRYIGHTPEFIDFRLKRSRISLVNLLLVGKRMKFNRFRKKYFLNKTQKYMSLTDLRKDPPKSDVYMIGSDQTWNPTISKDSALAYFADFGNSDVKRISYAASFGTSKWCETVYAPIEDVRKSLSRFSKLLVRENSAIEICKATFNVNAQQVVDPVLLFKDYTELTGQIQGQDRKMIVYKLVNDEHFYEIAKKSSSRLGYEIFSIGSLRRKKGIKCSYPESIESWIRQFATAEFVFTDSFHGVVLSILYNKRFAVYPGDDRKFARIQSLLELCGLTDHILNRNCSHSDVIKVADAPVDYDKVNKIIQGAREESLDLLKQAIEE